MIARGRLTISLFLLVTALFFVQTVRIAAQSPLVWDAVSKEYSAKIGETNIYFTFTATNLSSADVVVTAVRGSCGCTIPKVPPLPWRLGPGTHGEIQVLVDIRGKHGTLSKVVSVDTSNGFSLLAVNVKIPEDRSRNMQMAAADRQAVFKYDCASCHVYPTYGKMGEALYQTACGICHESDHRASMVPDLKALTKPTNPAYWDTWIRKGKEGSLMPAFANTEGGPLNDEQVKSLVEYLSKKFTALDLGNPFGTQ
jgi:cytochrome c553